jgi:hypothetical protein
MHIREYTDADLSALRQLHSAQNLPYRFPDLANPLFLTKLVVENESSSSAVREVVAAALLRVTAEAYLLLDPHAGTPRDRWNALLLLHEAARADAARRGLDDVHAWLPPQVAQAFGRRLARLGWFAEPWPSYSRATRAVT